MVNIESPQSRRPRSSMTPTETEQTRRSCSICKKLFCCSQCRERHEKTKHSKQQLDCPFCMSHKLPSQTFEDKPLLVHIVIAHLPLYCYLCGEVYKQSKDIESFGTCKWWKSRHRHSLGSEQKDVLGTPPLIPEGKESSVNNEYNGNFGSLTSPPALYRTTSTPMVVGEKNSFDFKTPNVPNFTLKTPKTSSASLKKEQTHSGFQESAESNYLSFPSSVNQENTPFRALSSSRGTKDDLSRNNSKKLDIMKEQDRTNPGEQCASNSDVVDMELTGIEGEAGPDSQGLDMCVQVEKRSDSLKKVRFSDQYENFLEPSATSAVNMTENEEYFEAHETLSEVKENLENSQIKIYAENVQNTTKEIHSPDKQNGNVNQQSSGSSRVVMMVVVENNSNLSTSDLIDSGLKKLGHIASGTSLPIGDSGTSAYSSSVTTVNNYYSLSSQASYSTSNQMISSLRRDSNSSSNSTDSGSSVGIFSAVANAMRTVMRNFSGAGTTRHIDREQVPPRENIVPRPSISEAFHPLSSLASSLLQRPGKRPREVIESVPSPQRQLDVVVPEVRSPLAKRPRGWYRIKGREPIARMRNSRITSPRGVSSETQVFHQGSLSVGDTVLPLPSRAHQSTQTE